MSDLEEYLLIVDEPKYIKEFYNMRSAEARAIDYVLIIEQFQKLLGVYTATEALAKTAVLMREEEDLQNDIISTFVNFCWTHYWDTFANDVPIIMDHIESIIEFVKADIKKRRG